MRLPSFGCIRLEGLLMPWENRSPENKGVFAERPPNCGIVNSSGLAMGGGSASSLKVALAVAN